MWSISKKIGQWNLRKIYFELDFIFVLLRTVIFEVNSTHAKPLISFLPVVLDDFI